MDSPEVREKREITEIETYILEGLEFIKGGQFDEAKLHFRNRRIAESLGFKMSASARPVFISRTPTEDEIGKYSDMVAQQSRFDESDMDIIVSDIVKPIQNGQTIEFPVPEGLLENIALIHAEEWLHGLQFLRGNEPIAGFEDDEIDVAAYMLQHGVKLTEEFLNRYQRREQLGKLAKPETV